MGSVGYCMGGRHVMSAAAAYPDRFRASAGLHPTSLISGGPDSPHLLADRLRGEFYCGFAETDPYAPPAMIQELGGILAACPVRYHPATGWDRVQVRGAGHPPVMVDPFLAGPGMVFVDPAIVECLTCS